MCAHTPQKFQELVELQENYEKGRIDRETVSDLMEMAIDAELTKADVEIDNAWLNACIDLMAYVDHADLEQASEQHRTTWKVIRTGIRKERWRKHTRTIGRTACAVACAVLVITGVSISWRWFRPSQSTDEQVYTLTGEQIQLGADQRATAAQGDTPLECHTTSLQELCDFIGYIPPMPSWTPEGWILKEYAASSNETMQNVTMIYEKAGTSYILAYDFTQTNDVASLSTDYYQDDTGEYIQLRDDLYVYLATNMDQPCAVWSTANSISSASGPITQEELITFVLSIR